MDMYMAKLIQLAELAKELGQDKEEWFRSWFQRLVDCWNETLYQKAMDMLRSYDHRPILDRTFPVPMSPDDLEAVNGPYRIGTIANTDIEFGFSPQTELMKSYMLGCLCSSNINSKKSEISPSEASYTPKLSAVTSLTLPLSSLTGTFFIILKGLSLITSGRRIRVLN